MARHIQLQNTKFLEDLPLSIPRYAYNGIDQFREIIGFERERFERSNHSQGTGVTNEYVLFKIAERQIQTDFLNEGEATTNLALRVSYDLAAGLVLLKMMGPVHWEMQNKFKNMITLDLNAMGLRYAVHECGGVDIRGNGSGKESDAGWGPAANQPGHTGKPTVTLEVAVSESQAKLEQDVGWWLSPTKGGANVTVTVKVDRRAPRLTIDIWQWTGTDIERTQQVIISKEDSQVFVTGDPLIIPFHLFFLRQPTAGSGERDIVLDQQELVPFAESVWRVQGF
ncbi:hypothetical protein N7519_006405 [Penicillium mononematosum]|uniref:uncharacterized protein n=1 Tax=Penicillium mononematosum TaxID=268346 RepID=UPI00254847B1|nr:uncharacterized protein N7519_006405 [Penicillium mononematosum]KAJ6185104.1 hypothetical protein N7519_006405 [Penicillium mononematosum]